MQRNITRTSNRCLKTNVKEPCQQTLLLNYPVIQDHVGIQNYVGEANTGHRGYVPNQKDREREKIYILLETFLP